MPRDQSKMKTTDRSSSVEAKDVTEALLEALPGHRCLMSLADWKYSGKILKLPLFFSWFFLGENILSVSKTHM